MNERRQCALKLKIAPNKNAQRRPKAKGTESQPPKSVSQKNQQQWNAHGLQLHSQ